MGVRRLGVIESAVSLVLLQLLLLLLLLLSLAPPNGLHGHFASESPSAGCV